ncbi:hypothetical protein LCGC14_1159850 [marine sediment metagenome]|uniref:Uncharacterized protein n=1 Tax=marine sediment metagenome TaxID=412755 RepID=A0A0F9PYK7_9ZZZZ|nr:MAG: hypothetical protein Lokiarch_20530 [Candidatus Lokiarchaeum sp. GC14_75]
MIQNKNLKVESTVKLKFNDSYTRDISYNSFIPEIKNLQTNRSKIMIEKENKQTIIFKIKANDITAFRATMNEIIIFGKIVDNTKQLVEIS